MVDKLPKYRRVSVQEELLPLNQVSLQGWPCYPTTLSISRDVFGVHTTCLLILLLLQKRSVGSRFIPHHYSTVHTQRPLLSAFRKHVIFEPEAIRIHWGEICVRITSFVRTKNNTSVRTTHGRSYSAVWDTWNSVYIGDYRPTKLTRTTHSIPLRIYIFNNMSPKTRRLEKTISTAQKTTQISTLESSSSFTWLPMI